MSVITIRLDEKLEKLLRQESHLEKKSRSNLVRQAIEDFLRRMEHNRLKQTLVQEMKNLPSSARQEGLAIADEFLPAGNEALVLAEGRKPWKSKPEKKDKGWWK
jgi:predicted transcriptional regulator